MRSIAIVAFLSSLVLASHQPPYLRHRRLAESVEHIRDQSPRAESAPRANVVHSEAHQAIKRVVQKRGQQCRVKASPIAPTPTAVTTSMATTTTASSTATSLSTTDAASVNNQEAYAYGQSSSTTTWSSVAASSAAASSAATSSASKGPSFVENSGSLNVNDAKCGWCGSSANEPNGSEDWLNCGINNGGWTPPHVTMDQLVASSLSANGVFAPCAPYIDKFNAYAKEFNIHPIMLASFAMQESTCNPGATGGNGEAGLMQIAQPNCNNAGGSCWDVDYNIRRGAELFSGMISQQGGNVLAAIGSYNGWRISMTYDDATRAKSQGNCFAQNNLDYLYQFTNGWMQGRNGYNYGVYHNLNGC